MSSHSPQPAGKEKPVGARRVRVALTITELNVGGAERCLTNLAMGLDPQRFEPQVYSLGPRPTGRRDALVALLETRGIPIYFLNLQSAAQLLRGAKALISLYRQNAPDVVQTFLFHANVLGVFAAGRAHVSGIAMGVRVADPRRFRLGIERIAAARAQRIVCVSQSVAAYVTQRGRFPREKVVVIPNGIDLARYTRPMQADPISLGVPPGRRLIVSVGRLDHQKGLDWLLSMAPRLLELAPNHDLVFVGDGPQQAALANRAKELAITQRVHFPGWRCDIPEILAASDLLVLPSRWEGMPNVVLEAMACGTPVVATKSEGVVELLGATSDVAVATFGDSPAFIEKAVAILQREDLATRVRETNRRRAAELFSLEKMIAAYSSVYDELAGGE